MVPRNCRKPPRDRAALATSHPGCCSVLSSVTRPPKFQDRAAAQVRDAACDGTSTSTRTCAGIPAGSSRSQVMPRRPCRQALPSWRRNSSLVVDINVAGEIAEQRYDDLLS